MEEAPVSLREFWGKPIEEIELRILEVNFRNAVERAWQEAALVTRVPAALFGPSHTLVRMPHVRIGTEWL